MADVFDAAKRSQVMSRIRSRDTVPERELRRVLHRLGFRFRLRNGQQLFGRPDVVLPKYRAVVFLHGCFWHRHRGCRYCYIPKTRVEFWQRKFAANRDRDQEVGRVLRGQGWQVVVVWECQLKNRLALESRLMQIKCGDAPRVSRRATSRRSGIKAPS